MSIYFLLFFYSFLLSDYEKQINNSKLFPVSRAKKKKKGKKTA